MGRRVPVGRLGGVGCVGAAVASAMVAALVDGMRAAASTMLVAAVVLAFFVTGQLAERIALRFADIVGLALALASYAVRVTALGVVLWWAMSHPAATGWMPPLWVAVGALASVIGWLAGLVAGHSRARIAIYDTPYRPPAGWDE